jgi:predicted dehydrogenase
LVAVVDARAESLSALRDKLNLDEHVLLAQTWEAVRHHPEVEAVAIATPASTHYPLIRDALQRGDHVLSEKPLTLDVAECLELCRLAQKQQRQLMVDHTYLFHPAVDRGREVVRSGTLGELRYGYAARTNLGPVRQDVDALWDLAIHDIAIFNSWLGELPSQVRATGRVWLQREAASNAPELADLVDVTLTYPTGFQASIHLCWLNPDKQRRLGVVGSQGTLIFDEMLAEAPLILQHGYLEQEGEGFSPAGVAREVLAIEAREPLRTVCDRFLGSIRSQQPYTLSSGWVGAELVQILSGLSQSLQQGGQPVKIPALTLPSD